jgi:hypothetical protein
MIEESSDRLIPFQKASQAFFGRPFSLVMKGSEYLYFSKDNIVVI